MQDDTSDEPGEKGFQFPGVFEIMAAGPVEAKLEQVIPRELAAAGLTVLQETVRSRASSGGRFVSVTVSFRADSRAEYDAAHVALRAHPDVKWTL
jgi:putative lipoic acid-binding regulatory protein